MNTELNKDIENKASKLWGGDLHQSFGSAPIHCTQLIDIFPALWQHSMKGHLLEIGCGSGADLEYFLKMSAFSQITAIDLGVNIKHLKNKLDWYPKISLKDGLKKIYKLNK